MKRNTETTATFLVLDALKRADDFRTGRQLMDETRLSTNRVSAALYHLLKYKAVEFIESERKLWWFATPTSDTRSKTVDERVMESKPRKVRRSRAKKVTP